MTNPSPENTNPYTSYEIAELAITGHPFPPCDICGESCQHGAEVRTWETDPETGAADETVICSFCVADEPMGNRNPARCAICDSRLGIGERDLCAECEPDEADYMEISKTADRRTTK